MHVVVIMWCTELVLRMFIIVTAVVYTLHQPYTCNYYSVVLCAEVLSAFHCQFATTLDHTNLGSDNLQQLTL